MLNKWKKNIFATVFFLKSVQVEKSYCVEKLKSSHVLSRENPYGCSPSCCCDVVNQCDNNFLQLNPQRSWTFWRKIFLFLTRRFDSGESKSNRRHMVGIPFIFGGFMFSKLLLCSNTNGNLMTTRAQITQLIQILCSIILLIHKLSQL